MADPSANIKEVRAEDLTTVQECDYWLAAVRSAIVNMQGQLDKATECGHKKWAEFDVSDQKWLGGLKGALRHAKRIEAEVDAKRSELLRTSTTTLEEVVLAFEDAEFKETPSPTVTVTVAAPVAQRWLRAIKSIIPNLK